MTSKTMRFRECGGVLLAVHTADAPTDEEWEAYIQFCLTLPPSCNKTLVLTLGGGPNAGQRKALQDRYLDKQKRANKEYLVAVMTDSALVRGIVKALNWFNKDANSFPYDGGAGVSEALKHLRIDSVTAGRISLELQKMRIELGMK